MLKKTITLAGILLLAVAALPAFAAAPSAREAKLIAVLKSPKATFEAKSAACQELARIGTKASVPALAALLGDEKLSHMARYAMEPIRDPAVDDALRAALGKIKGRPLLGVIGSIGVRRDAKAVPALAKMLSSADAAVAEAAARALGSIGTPPAVSALNAALQSAQGAKQQAVCEGLFRSAEALTAQKQTAQAQAIYDRLRKLTDAPRAIRAAALRGAILTRGNAGIPLLVEAIRGSDYMLTTAAARAAMELPSAEVTSALCEELPKLPADKQILIVKTLGYRGDAAAGPALLPLAAEGPEEVRVAAIENLTHLSYAPALPLLAKLSLKGTGEAATAARTCLGNFPGKDADAAIAAMLDEKDPEVRALAVQMIGQRNVAAAASLLKAANDGEEIVRLAALKELRQRAGAAELPALLDHLTKARSPDELAAAESAIAAVCIRAKQPTPGSVTIVKAQYGDLAAGIVADVTEKVAALVKSGVVAIDASNDNFGDPADGHVKQLRIDYRSNGLDTVKTVAENETLTIASTVTSPAVVDAICAAIPAAPAAAKLALLRVLRVAGGAKALATVESAMGDRHPRIKEAALRVLCDWPTADALPLLAELVKTPTSKPIKALAMKGLVRLVPKDNATDGEKFAILKGAFSVADGNADILLLLSALSNVPTLDSITLAASQIDNPAVKEEACIAAVDIAEKLPSPRDARVAAVMRKVAKTTANKELAARAEKIARRGK